MYFAPKTGTKPLGLHFTNIFKLELVFTQVQAVTGWLVSFVAAQIGVTI